jgi:hypothetical protein
MPQYFPHENLETNAHALRFVTYAAALIDSWPTVFVCG